MESTKKETAKQGRIGFRPFWVLNVSILLRAIHQIGAAVFLAAYLIDDIGPAPLFYVILAGVSGTALLLTEWLRHRQIYREISGLSTLVKLLLLGLAFHDILPQTTTVLATFIIASVASHAPKQFRHRLLF